MVGVDLGDLSRKICEWAFLDANRFPNFVIEFWLRARRCFCAVGLWSEERANLTTAEWGWPLPTIALSNKTRDTRGVSDAVPRLVVHLATDEKVPREYFALNGLLFAVLELDDVFHWGDDFIDLVLHVH